MDGPLRFPVGRTPGREYDGILMHCARCGKRVNNITPHECPRVCVTHGVEHPDWVDVEAK